MARRYKSDRQMERLANMAARRRNRILKRETKVAVRAEKRAAPKADATGEPSDATLA